MYKCNKCGAVFRTPRYDQPSVYHVNPGGSECVGEPICPECGAYEFAEVKRCSRCGTLIEADGPNMCEHCRKWLLLLINNFFDDLGEAQIDQFDEWMDGDSIRNRKQWS